MATQDPILTASRILNSSRVAQAADDTDVTGWDIENEFIVVIQIDEEKGPWTADYKIQWMDVTDTSGYSDLAASGELAWGTDTDLANGTDVLIGEKACTNTPGRSGWANGIEIEGATNTGSYALSDEDYTEFHCAVNPAGADHNHKYRFRLYDDTNSVEVGVASAEITVINTPPVVILNTADATNFGADTTPTLEFTGTDPNDDDIRYNIQIDTVNTFDSQSSDEIIDSYSETNQDSDFLVGRDSDAVLVAGQSFTGDGNDTEIATAYIKKVGSPNVNIVAKIFAHTGVFGTSSLPTGSVLATSNTVSTSTLTTSYQLIEFTFDTPYTTINGTKYCVIFEYNEFSATGNSDYIAFGADSSSPSHGGNLIYWQPVAYLADNTKDLCFYISVDVSTPLLDKLSGTDALFTNTTDGGDSDPFDSGDMCDYTVQAGDALSDDTYYWRVKGLDPTGSISYGSWAATRSFIVGSAVTYQPRQGFIESSLGIA